MSKRWEYKCLEFDVTIRVEQAIKVCNELGQQGWKMCQGKAGFWFMRKIPKDDADER